MASMESSFWCYRCSRFIRVRVRATYDSILCPECGGGFVEDIGTPSRSPLHHRLPAAAMYPSNPDHITTPRLRRNRRSGGDRSPFNPVIVLRGPADGGGANDGASGTSSYTMTMVLVCRHELPTDLRGNGSGSGRSSPESGEETVGLTIWRLPGGGFAVGRFTGGRRAAERELPVVFTEMDGGFNAPTAPRMISWAPNGRRSREGSGLGRAFRNFFSFFGRIGRRARDESGLARRSRSNTMLARSSRRENSPWFMQDNRW
ncbi:hypothetical protein GH714_010000 [Hevea brasiliensis]|uniref:RING-type E3 ubiquitin transferase n=1 Tax=Hevea brasiliensis TaxID=3981 RepID=A0A6A6KK29_HEVBR|nr:hypothetical protein GH714_010000 [Hevea brasiliensis]